MKRGLLAISLLVWAPTADAADEITSAEALIVYAMLIESKGFNCAKATKAWSSGTDEFGDQVRVVCPGGNGPDGLRYRISLNPRTKNLVVRHGW
jgi:hypothetical protein